MVKAWVVHASLWAFKVGLIGVLTTVIPLASSEWVRRKRLLNRTLIIVLGSSTAVALFAGWVHDFLAFWVALAGIVFAAVAYGAVRLTRWFLPVVLLLVCYQFVPGLLMSEDRTTMQTPLLQVQLTPGLECRAYPKYYDSMVGTRLVVARTDRSWIWDEITEVISLTPRVKEYGCRLDPDGQVRFWYVEEQEYKEVVRKLE